MIAEKHFFTAKGTEQVKEHYFHLLREEFSFDLENPEVKTRLILIREQGSGYGDNAFYIRFYDANGYSLAIHEFMDLNKINYRFEDFENLTVIENF